MLPENPYAAPQVTDLAQAPGRHFSPRIPGDLASIRNGARWILLAVGLALIGHALYIVDKFLYPINVLGMWWQWVLLGATWICNVAGMLLFLSVHSAADIRRPMSVALNFYVGNVLMHIYILAIRGEADLHEQMLWLAAWSFVELIYVQSFLLGVMRLGDYVDDPTVRRSASRGDKCYLVGLGCTFVFCVLMLTESFGQRFHWIFTEEGSTWFFSGFAILLLLMFVGLGCIVRAMWRLKNIEHQISASAQPN